MTAAAGALDDPRLAAQALGLLFVAGAAIGLVSLLLPHPPHANVPGLYSNVGLAFAGGIALLIGARRIRPWMLHVALVSGTLLIARAVVLSGEGVSFYSVWFIWVGLYAFYFFSRRAAVTHLTFTSLVYAATLINNTPSSPVARWLTTVATLIVAGGFIDTLVRRARDQATAAAASAKQMVLVSELAHELAELSDGQAARQALCAGVVRVTGASAAALWEADGQGTGLEITAATREHRISAAIPFAGPSHGVIEAYVTGRPPAGGSPHPTASPEGIEASSAFWQPILRDQLTVAVLELDFPRSVSLEDGPTLTLTNLLAVEAAVTLQRVALLSELQTTARTDELTGLPNRRAWQEQLPRQLIAAGRSGAVVSLAMIDLDHFKRFNDTRGHQAGDRLLKEIAGAWTAELRPGDLLVRYGGEEFALALPRCAPADALAIVERLRSQIPDRQTCSAGIVYWDGRESTAELVSRADDALYQAKRGGRNQSVIVEPTNTEAISTPTSADEPTELVNDQR